MDERELVGLLYRADWTRLALAGTVRGGDTGLHTIVIESDDGSGSERSWSAGPFGPPSAPPFAPFPPFPPSSDDPDTYTERTLIVAPGKRYREETTDGDYASGCDGAVEIESEWTARRRERLAGRLCEAISTFPLKHLLLEWGLSESRKKRNLNNASVFSPASSQLPSASSQPRKTWGERDSRPTPERTCSLSLLLPSLTL